MKNVKHINHNPNIKPAFRLNLSSNLKNETHYYMSIPRRLGNIDIYNSKSLNPSIKVIFGDIYTMNVQGKLYYKSNVTISETLGFSKYTVNKAIKFLKDHHWINIIYSRAPKCNFKKFIYININHFRSAKNQPTNKKRLHGNQTTPSLKNKPPKQAENHATLARKSSTNKSVNRSGKNRSMNRSDSASDATKKLKIKNRTKNQNLKQNQNPKKSRTNIDKSKTKVESSTSNKMHNKGLKPEREEQKSRENSTSSNVLVGSKDYPSTKLSRRIFTNINKYVALTSRDINYARKCCRQWVYCVDTHLIPESVCGSITDKFLRLYAFKKIHSGREFIVDMGIAINSHIKRSRSRYIITQCDKAKELDKEQRAVNNIKRKCNVSDKYDPKAYSNSLDHCDYYDAPSLKDVYNKYFPKLDIVQSQYSAKVGYYFVDKVYFNIKKYIKKCEKYEYKGEKAVDYLLKCTIDNYIFSLRYSWKMKK